MATPKRKPGDQKRTQIWYNLVMEGVIRAGYMEKKIGARAFGKELGKIAERFELPWKGGRGHLGSPEAWRWWQDGARTPGDETRAAVDSLLFRLGEIPIGWVVAGLGEMELSPVWAWPTSMAGLTEQGRRAAEVVEAELWQQVAEMDSRSFLNIAFIAGDLGMPPKKNVWPPLLLLPVAVASILPREEGAPLPHLKISPPSDEKGVTGWVRSIASRLARDFAGWSMRRGRYLPGDVWFSRLRELPGQPLYVEGEMESAVFGAGCAAAEERTIVEAARHVLVAASETANDGK